MMLLIENSTSKLRQDKCIMSFFFVPTFTKSYFRFFFFLYKNVFTFNLKILFIKRTLSCFSVYIRLDAWLSPLPSKHFVTQKDCVCSSIPGLLPSPRDSQSLIVIFCFLILGCQISWNGQLIIATAVSYMGLITVLPLS